MIHPNSYIQTLNGRGPKLLHKIICILVGLIWTSPYRGWIYIPGKGIYDVASSSSRSLEMLAADRCLIQRARVRGGFELFEKMYLTKFRKNHVECIPIEFSPAGTKQQIKDNL